MVGYVVLGLLGRGLVPIHGKAHCLFHIKVDPRRGVPQRKSTGDGFEILVPVFFFF